MSTYKIGEETEEEVKTEEVKRFTLKEVERIQAAATQAAEQVEKEKIEKQFKETEEVVEQWKGTFEPREEVVKESVTFLTVKEPKGAKFHDPKDVYSEMKAEAVIDRECVWVLHLNNQSKVMKKELVAMGNGNSSQITGREIFRRAIIEGATSVIMVHNHPGGDPEPSEADKVVSARIRDAGKLIGIKLLDFMVIAANGYYSFAREGLLDVLRREG